MTMKLTSVRIVGSGLIGTSIGLGLKSAGVEISFFDSDKSAQKLAQDLIGPPSSKDPDLVIFAVPPSALPSLLDSEFALNPASRFMDIGSIKIKPTVEVTSSILPGVRFCPTHPMAGREIGGAQSAQGDLFLARPWIYSPHGVDPDVVEAVLSVIKILGADPIILSPAEHDRAVALISHLPQIIASLLAKQLVGAPHEWLQLAGSGLRDSTRIAASDPQLWREIISANREEVLPLLKNVEKDLLLLIENIDHAESVSAFISEGNVGRARIPGKHGGKAREYTKLHIVIDDKPGQLAKIFDECAQSNVNVEDLNIEHSPGQETGLITLYLSHEHAEILQQHLASNGWKVHKPG